MKTTIIKEIIFVFGNPFQKVRELAEQYNITVVGTNDPEMLIEQLKCSNDCKDYFFIITNDTELTYVNDMFSKLDITGTQRVSRWFILSDKKYEKRVNPYKNQVHLATYDPPITEKILEEYILHINIYDSTQYELVKEVQEVKRVNTSKMRNISRNLQQNFTNESMLQGIREQFKIIAENQSSTPVSVILNHGIATNVQSLGLKTQEYLTEEVEKLEEELKNAHSTEDVKKILSVIMELYEMMSTDLKESSKYVIDGMIKDTLKKTQDYQLTSSNLIAAFDNALLQKDKHQIENMIKVREEKVKEIRKMETEIMSNANALKSGLDGSLKMISSRAKDIVSTHGNLIDNDQKLALQNTFNESSRELKNRSIEMVSEVQNVIEDLQIVVSGYSKIVDFDTTLIETQQRQIKALETQNITENVKYMTDLTAKIRLIVSPTPNLGASTIAKLAKYKFENVLLLDFRELTSDTEGYEEIRYSDFLSKNINEFEGKNIKVFSTFATEVDKDVILRRLESISDMFESILILVDRYFTTGINFDKIQRVMYLSNLKDSNLLIVNETRVFYEPVLENLKQVSMTLNMAADNVYDILDDKLTVAGVDVASVRINILPLRNELMAGVNEESELKKLSEQFKF